MSDEIHADFVYKGNHFNSVAALKTGRIGYAVCTSPSKTFNLAGLHNANIYIPDPFTREKFVNILNRKGYSQSNIMGIVACEAAYRYGGEWHAELLEYLEGNLNFLRGYIKENIPKIHLVEPEGTYLVWLDFRGLGLTDDELNKLMVEKAGLWLDPGSIFGRSGEGFERVNIACPRTILRTALEKLSDTFGKGRYG